MDEKRPVTIIGTYVFIPNPCNTKPCLPGMAYAVEQREGAIFLTVDGKLLNESHIWKDCTPKIDSTIRVTGYVRQLIDVFGEPYKVIEVQSMGPIR